MAGLLADKLSGWNHCPRGPQIGSKLAVLELFHGVAKRVLACRIGLRDEGRLLAEWVLKLGAEDAFGVLEAGAGEGAVDHLSC